VLCRKNYLPETNANKPNATQNLTMDWRRLPRNNELNITDILTRSPETTQLEDLQSRSAVSFPRTSHPLRQAMDTVHGARNSKQCVPIRLTVSYDSKVFRYLPTGVNRQVSEYRNAKRGTPIIQIDDVPIFGVR
jgi:hypothetical protein